MALGWAILHEKLQKSSDQQGALGHTRVLEPGHLWVPLASKVTKNQGALDKDKVSIPILPWVLILDSDVITDLDLHVDQL